MIHQWLDSASSTVPVHVIGAAVGPVLLRVLGYDVPILSAALSLVGVLLAVVIAPPAPRPLSVGQRLALTGLLVLLALALPLSGVTHSPLLSLGWAIGVGYSGLPIMGDVARVVTRFVQHRGAQIAGDEPLDTAKDDDAAH